VDCGLHSTCTEPLGCDCDAGWSGVFCDVTNYQWHTFYGASTNIDWGHDITTDSYDNIYVTGGSQATWTGPSGELPLHPYSGNWDISIIKLNSDGIYQWHTFYGSVSDDYSYSITTDSDDNIYIIGNSDTAWTGPSGELPLHSYSGFGIDIFIIKLNSDGIYQWHTFYGSGDYDYGYDIATDSDDNIYVTGYSWAAWIGPSGELPLHPYSGGRDIYILKLNSNGIYQWHTFYGSGNNDEGYDIATDSYDNIYVTGKSLATWTGPSGELPLHPHNSSSYDISLLKLNSNGIYQWHTFYGSGDYNYGSGITLDSYDNIYVTGYSWAPWTGPSGELPLHSHSDNSDISILKLNSDGIYQWHTFYGSSGSDNGWGITTDSYDNIYVTGYSNATWTGPSGELPLHPHSGDTNIPILKLNSDGIYQWHTFYGAVSDDEGYSITTDSYDNIYVTGYSSATWTGPSGELPLHPYSGGYDILILKLTP
jgi:uncharacterized delta-60 repeat protein